MSEHVSTEYATRWYQELFKQIETLQQRPTVCPVAHDSERSHEEIRELVYRKQRHKNKYRVLFTICEETVVVLYVYHSSRTELNP
jgi:mRNA-degrading endonuclease RelE of RelBE toxin-antitoxin system